MQISDVSFKPYYKWIIFNIDRDKSYAEVKRKF